MVKKKKVKNLVEQERVGENMSETQVLESLESEIDRVRIELEKAKAELEEKKNQLKSMPAREVSEDEMVIVKKQVAVSSEKIALKEKIARQKAHDNVMVTKRFLNRRAPGNPAKLTYMKYEDDPVKWSFLEDGKVYTVPQGFVDQVNEYYHTPRFIKKEGPMDPTMPSSQIHEVDTSNKKYAFVSVN